MQKVAAYGAYLDGLCTLLQQIQSTQAEALCRAARLVSDTILDGGLVYTFGSAHSQLVALEVHGRAGSLCPIVQIMDPLWGRVERVEGVAPALLKGLPFRAGDTIFVISNSGRNPQPIEVALRARELGLHVIAITSMAHSRSVSSRHSSQKKLFELAEVVLDTGAPAGDTSLSLAGLPAQVGPVSTVLGAALLNAVVVQASQYILDAGQVPPILMSANIEGGDAHNARVVARYAPLNSVFGPNL